MKKLLSIFCFISLSLLPAQPKTPPIPKNFTVLSASKTAPESQDLFFYILVTAQLADPQTKKVIHRTPKSYEEFTRAVKIPKDFIKPGVPLTSVAPSYTLVFEWSDTGSKTKIVDAATAFVSALSRMNANFKKKYTCHYLIVAEGRSGLLVNHASNLLAKETFNFAVAVEIGAPLVKDSETDKLFIPNFKKIGTLFHFYSQYAYLSNSAHTPATVSSSSYPSSFVYSSKNLYNLRLLINNNQLSLQNIFGNQSIGPKIRYFGNHIFEICNTVKTVYKVHHDLWVSVETQQSQNVIAAIISHPKDDATKEAKKEHAFAGMQRERFENQVPDYEKRINLSDGAKIKTKYRSTAQVKKLEKLTHQTA